MNKQRKVYVQRDNGWKQNLNENNIGKIEVSIE